MRERVLQELTRIGRQHNVRILLAVESGSRAWGFASPDSDYDIRFVYAHDRDWYLSIFEDRDVIEEMLPDRLDINGWDLRKTLRLFAKCNFALNEWLGSPIVYSEAPGFRNRLVKMIPRYFNPISAMHHYRSMADRALAEHLTDGQIAIKKLFYVLRPLLACRWIRHKATQPPTEFEKLTAPSWIAAEEREWIANLLKQKSVAFEAQSVGLDEGRANGILSELDRYKSEPERLPVSREPNVVELDEFFREFVLKPSREPGNN
jgi:predicted nucleotidyltransferase